MPKVSTPANKKYFDRSDRLNLKIEPIFEKTESLDLPLLNSELPTDRFELDFEPTLPLEREDQLKSVDFRIG